MVTGTDKRTQRIELGRLGKAHGIKGWLRLNSFTNPPDNICSYTTFATEIAGEWVALELDQFRMQGSGLVVHIKGYDAPETASLLTGKGVWVDSKELPVLIGDEYYWHQLHGLKVMNQHGDLFGEVVELLETGANDVLVVQATADSIDKRERLIPYLTGKVVQQVSLIEGVIRVNWEADYLE
ncbi:MAG: ribosome maturation factor RimM [Gammaproteobacteria bacterium]|nr:ribosome maturation factor RimM [Gammaproteobacteria bacterium]